MSSDHSLCLEAATEGRPRPAALGVAKDLAERIGLKRKTYFTWKKLGETRGDPLPIADPTMVPAWYDRMKALGEFKHRCPRSVIAACSGKTQPPTQPAPVRRGDVITRDGPSENSAGNFFSDVMEVGHDAPRGIMVEVDELEKRVAALRTASDAAFRAGDSTRGTQLRAQYQEELEKLRKLKKDAAKLLADDEESTRKSWVAEDIGSIFPATIEQWMQEGGAFHRESQSALPRGEFLRLWRSVVTRVCQRLAQSRFAPPLRLEEMAETSLAA